jgi:monoamine oxidase
MGSTKKPSVIIVGAGAGGIATAARLAKAGLKVTVIEKNDFTGGRCSLIHRDGYVSDIFHYSSSESARLTTCACRGSTRDRVYYSSHTCSMRPSGIWTLA